MNRSTRVTWIVAGLICLAASPALGGWQVWTVTETRRVLGEDPAEKPTTVRLACAGKPIQAVGPISRNDRAIQEGRRVP